MTDAYKIGVTVALTNLVSTELARIGEQFFHVGRQADGFRAALLNIGKLGAVVGLAGAAIALKAGVEEARRFQLEATKFSALGFGDQINGQAETFAKGMKTVGTSATENMALVADAMAVFKSLPHAEMAAPLMARMKFANETLYGEEGGARESKFMDMLKVIEFRGGLRSDAEFEAQANFVQKVINGSRGRVDATQLLNALKTGGVALAGTSNEGFYLGSEPLIQEFGGSRFGTANMSIYQNLVQMRTTQQALSELMRLGLLDPAKVELNAYTGKVKRAQGGALRGAEVLTKEGDLAFLEKVLLPAFRSHGITSDDATIMELGRILTNRTGSSLLSRVYQQRATLHTQMEANKSAMDIGQMTAAADTTLDGKLIELHRQWANVLRDLGEHVLPGVIWGVGKLTDALRWLTGESAHEEAKTVNPNSPDARFKDKIHSWFGGASTVPPAPAASAVQINHSTVLDGQVIARSVTKYQLEGVAGAPSQPSGFDPKMSFVPNN